VKENVTKKLINILGMDADGIKMEVKQPENLIKLHRVLDP
jgi:hypothetical protein